MGGRFAWALISDHRASLRRAVFGSVGIIVILSLGFELGVAFLERVRDVLEEDQAITSYRYQGTRLTCASARAIAYSGQRPAWRGGRGRRSSCARPTRPMIESPRPAARCAKRRRSIAVTTTTGTSFPTFSARSEFRNVAPSMPGSIMSIRISSGGLSSASSPSHPLDATGTV